MQDKIQQVWIFRVKKKKQKETAIVDSCMEINEHIHSKVFQTASRKLTWCWNCKLATAVWQHEEVVVVVVFFFSGPVAVER